MDQSSSSDTDSETAVSSYSSSGHMLTNGQVQLIVIIVVIIVCRLFV